MHKSPKRSFYGQATDLLPQDTSASKNRQQRHQSNMVVADEEKQDTDRQELHSLQRTLGARGIL